MPLKIIQTSDSQLLEEVVTASNNQNKMSARNLRSNSLVQRTLQRKFDSLPNRYYYERKDGEFESEKKYSKRGPFRAQNYQFGSNFRTISNDTIAKTWLSFIGFSGDASERINAFEVIDDNGRYEWLFERRPSPEHWNLIKLGPPVKFNEENFDVRTPEPEQYLLSYFIFEFIRAYLPTPQVNKRECLNRLQQSGSIDDSSSVEDIDQALMADNNYVLNQVLYNMKEVIVELYTWTLVQAYGPLIPETVKNIMNLPGIVELYRSPNFRDYVRRIDDSDTDLVENPIENVLFVCFEFIKEAVKRWFSVHSREYLSSQRRIRHLHSARVIEQMKVYLDSTNDDTKEWPYKWKPPDVDFLQSLPRLPRP